MFGTSIPFVNKTMAGRYVSLG